MDNQYDKYNQNTSYNNSNYSFSNNRKNFDKFEKFVSPRNFNPFAKGDSFYNTSFTKKPNNYKDEYSFFQEKSYDQKQKYGNHQPQFNYYYQNDRNFNQYRNKNPNNYYNNNYNNDFYNNYHNANNNYYNNDNNNYNYNNNVSNFNDNSYYSYNNDSNVSFKKKNFKNKHYNINENNNYENNQKFIQESNPTNINIVAEINKEDENVGNTGNVNDNVGHVGYQVGNIEKKKPPQPIDVGDEEVNENYEKKREEMCVLEYLNYVNEKYPHLVKINEHNKNISKTARSQTAPRFFIIKSFTEEDIHKSIKYNCWSSTKEGNKKLDRAYADALELKSDIFLFFSMNTSGRFTGIAKINGRLEENYVFEYWALDEVWKGLFPVEWIIIKDLPNRVLTDIKLVNNSNKPVTNSRDTQEIPRPEGEQMLKIFEEYNNTTNILQHFQYYDERQELYDKSRKLNDERVDK